MIPVETSPFQFMTKWTPKAIAVAVGRYYSLGIAYDFGLMALIDKISIEVIKHFARYVGLSAFMPTIQWHELYLCAL